MLRKIKSSVAAALCCTVLGTGAAGCDGRDGELGPPNTSAPVHTTTAGRDMPG